VFFSFSNFTPFGDAVSQSPSQNPKWGIFQYRPTIKNSDISQAVLFGSGSPLHFSVSDLAISKSISLLTLHHYSQWSKVPVKGVRKL